MIKNAIQILKDGMQDIRTYITAIVVTGYVWNNKIYALDSMRPLDDFDIIRLYLYLKTVRKHNIPIDSIAKIERHRKNKLIVNNVDIYIPVINNQYQLEKEDLVELSKLNMQSLVLYNQNKIEINLIHDEKPIIQRIQKPKVINYEKYKDFGFKSKPDIKANAWIKIDDNTVGVILDKKEHHHWYVMMPFDYYKIISSDWEDLYLKNGSSIKLKTKFKLREGFLLKNGNFIEIKWNNLLRRAINKKFPEHFGSKIKNEVIMVLKSSKMIGNKCLEVDFFKINL